MTRGQHWVRIAAVLVPVAGCDALSLGGIFGARADGGVGQAHLDASLDDAAPPRPDATLVDAAVHDSASHDAAARDSGEGHLDADASRRFCATLDGSVLFCEDFDRDDAGLVPAWSAVQPPTSGTLGLDPSQHVSAPYSLLFAIPDGGDGQPTFVTEAFTQSFSSFTVAFDLRIGIRPNDSTYYAEVDMPGKEGSKLSAILQVIGGATRLEERIVAADGGLAFPDHDLPTISPSTWSRITIVINLNDAGTSTATVTIGDAGTPPPLKLDPRWAPSNGASLLVGFTYVNLPQVARSANVDNVVVTGSL